MARRRKREVEVEESDAAVIIISRQGAPFRPSRGSRRDAKQQGKLDSNLFDFYQGNLWERIPEEKKSNFTYVDCSWFSYYTNMSVKEKVLRWITEKHIFSTKYVLVPIVLWSHWNLLIFCNFDQSLESKTSPPCMLLLDSLQMAGTARFEPLIRKFVLDIFEAEERPEDKRLISKIPLLVPKVPQQRDDKGCGQYVLYFLSLFVENAPENFSTTEGYPYFLKEDWFTDEDFNCFSEKLKSFSHKLDISHQM